MNITAFMISYHHSVPVFPICDLRAIHLNYLGVHWNYIKNLFCLDVCLNMSSSTIRYAWFCMSVCILYECFHFFLFYFLFFYILCTTYILKFYLVISAYTFVICSLKINQSALQADYVTLFEDRPMMSEK